MDIMKFESNFARHLLSKVLEKAIKKHTETNVAISIGKAELINNEQEEQAEVHLEITLAARPFELYSALSKLGFA